jgi:2-polyprenyl-3-methyl-5-hydroxy-6-metoxy-1,4-benzoquinol methylase
MNSRINEYANTMFRFENIHENWIQLCVDYLKFVFKDQIQNKVVLDYASGRGNWSVAFSRLGAKKVISIDSSFDNILRLKEYCKTKKIDNIEIICGDFLVEKYELPSDIVWVYGIMHHIKDIDVFLQKIKKFTAKNDSKYFFYTHNIDSLRHFLVTNARQILKYDSESDFMKDASCLIPSARLRCRDDLTAPYIKWYDKSMMAKTLEKEGFYIKEDIKDLFSFQFGKKNYEFSPNQFLCETKKVQVSNIQLKDKKLFENEILILQKLLDTLINNMNKDQMQNTMLGFVNTYYSKKDLGYDALIIELGLYLIYWIMYYNIRSTDADVIKVLECAKKSQSGMDRDDYYGNLILEYLKANNIRI